MFRIPAILFLLIILLTPLAAQSPWTPGTYYARGVQVTYQGVTYSCLQSHTAIVSWEPVSTPALWQVVNPRGTQCTSVPGAPRNLAASGTTSTGTTLSWTASTVSTGCNVSSYTVYRNGAAIGTATGTSFAVTGLAPSTSYQFTVSATDAAGVSTQSTAVTEIPEIAFRIDVFLRWRGRQGARIQLLPLGAGAKQQIFDDPAWLGVATRLVRAF